MNTHSIYLPPQTLNGYSIDAHPQNYIIAAGGQCEGAGAVTWLVPHFEENEDIIGKASKTAQTINLLQKQPDKIPKYYATHAERLLPLTSITQVKFSPNGKMLAVKGTDGEKDRVFIYEVHFPNNYNQVSNSNLKTFIKLELSQHFLSEFAWSPDSCDLAISTHLGQLIIYPVMTRIPLCDFENKKLRKGSDIKTLKVTNQQIMGITWSNDGKMIILQTYSELIAVKRKLVKKNLAYTKLQTRFPGELLDNKAVEQTQQQETKSEQTQVSNVQVENKEYRSRFLKYLPKGREKQQQHKRSLRTFYAIAIYKRQVAFSPDSNFLISTAGTFSQKEINSDNRAIAFASFIFTRKSLYGEMKPAVVLGGYRCPAVAAAFSPVLYEIDENRPNLSGLNYKMLFAVIAGCDIFVYDTQEFKPLCIYEGESFQDDYLTSVCFSFTGLQVIAFGSHSQYQFIDLHETANFSLKPLRIRKSCSKIQDMIQRQANSHFIVKACQKYHKDVQKKQKEQNKDSSTQNKAIPLPKYFIVQKDEPVLQPEVPIYAVTDAVYSELPTVQEKIDQNEIDYLCSLFDGKEEIISEIDKKE